ncbi:hypothetical protein [Streptomyces lycii]|uniref:Uncharacterized protein n=1 Tax=Streptomyces lycii TaxID=2654337 RepID=A0ABQ7FI67_9ACTN|nr:hypothetical protein [Streptomyces lycii]KAF4408612.1 hypothetical protein GCU69_13005 [Streptomyces lycii]
MCNVKIGQTWHRRSAGPAVVVTRVWRDVNGEAAVSFTYSRREPGGQWADYHSSLRLPVFLKTYTR